MQLKVVGYTPVVDRPDFYWAIDLPLSRNGDSVTRSSHVSIWLLLQAIEKYINSLVHRRSRFNGGLILSSEQFKLKHDQRSYHCLNGHHCH